MGSIIRLLGTPDATALWPESIWHPRRALARTITNFFFVLLPSAAFRSFFVFCFGDGRRLPSTDRNVSLRSTRPTGHWIKLSAAARPRSMRSAADDRDRWPRWLRRAPMAGIFDQFLFLPGNLSRFADVSSEKRRSRKTRLLLAASRGITERSQRALIHSDLSCIPLIWFTNKDTITIAARRHRNRTESTIGRRAQRSVAQSNVIDEQDLSETDTSDSSR